MATEFKTQIFRQEVPNFRSIHLYAEDHGDVKLSVQDIGHLVRDAWYDSDNEHGVNVQGIEAK